MLVRSTPPVLRAVTVVEGVDRQTGACQILEPQAAAFRDDQPPTVDGNTGRADEQELSGHRIRRLLRAEGILQDVGRRTNGLEYLDLRVSQVGDIDAPLVINGHAPRI